MAKNISKEPGSSEHPQNGPSESFPSRWSSGVQALANAFAKVVQVCCGLSKDSPDWISVGNVANLHTV